MNIAGPEFPLAGRRPPYPACIGIALILHTLILFAFKANSDFSLPESDIEPSGIEVKLEAAPSNDLRATNQALGRTSSRTGKPPQRAKEASVAAEPDNVPVPEQAAVPVKNKAETKPAPEQRPQTNAPGGGKEELPQALPHNPKPPYPELARKRGQEGLVVLRVGVDATGEAVLVEVHNSSGYPLLDESALTTVRKWRFKVSVENGRPYSGELLLPVEFRLR